MKKRIETQELLAKDFINGFMEVETKKNEHTIRITGKSNPGIFLVAVKSAKGEKLETVDILRVLQKAAGQLYE